MKVHYKEFKDRHEKAKVKWTNLEIIKERLSGNEAVSTTTKVVLIGEDGEIYFPIILRTKEINKQIGINSKQLYDRLPEVSV